MSLLNLVNVLIIGGDPRNPTWGGAYTVSNSDSKKNMKKDSDLEKWYEEEYQKFVDYVNRNF